LTQEILARDRFTPALEIYARIEKKNEGQKNNKKMSIKDLF
jgi:hypothetical protein